LHKRILNTPNEIEYLTELNPKKLWLLYEHRLKKGNTLIPGTAFLEFARSAMSHYSKSKEMVIKDVTFISPVMIDDDKKKLLSIKLQKNGDEYEFIISSMEENGTHEDWEENVRGIISLLNISAKKTFNIQEILSNCRIKKEEFSGIASHDHMIFGPRWSSLKEIHYGKTEAAAFIELPKEFLYDMEYYKIHPSLLDIATGSAQSLAGYDIHNEFFVPMTYSSIEIKDYLPSKIVSHIRYKGDHDNHKDIAVFDINIMDEDGTELIAISDFMMKKVSDSSNDSSSKFEARKAGKRKSASELLEIGQQAAILPSEGIKVFEKILSANSFPQIAAVSQDLHALEESLTFDHAKKIKHAAKGSDEVKSDNYAAPTNDIEKDIAEIWQEAMGIEKIGINDDFLELGGHSLLLTRIILRVRKKFNVDLSLSSLHEKPTIAQFASEVMKSRSNKEESSGIIPVSREKYQVKEIN
jgi:acyl carrier protein